jgi:DNA-binding response OmpR family regulator
MAVSKSQHSSEKLLRVILVEDDEAYADMVRRLLIAKFDLQHAGSLAELLDLGRRVEPDVILLDLGLPDGGDFIALVMKVVARFRDSAVIVTTGLDDEMLALEALRAGAQDYLVKEMYVRDQMVKKILHAHARHRATMRTAESTVALATAAASNDSMHIAAVNPDLLSKQLEERMERSLEEKILAKYHLRPRTDVFEPVPQAFNLAEVLNKVIKDNWKFLAAAIATITVYVTDFRDTVRDTAIAVQENAAAVELTAAATAEFEKKQKQENKKLRDGLIFALESTVKATEHLEELIKLSAPKVDFPASAPKVREVREGSDIEELRAILNEGGDEP